MYIYIYCLQCIKFIKNKNEIVSRTTNEITMTSTHCVACNNKKKWFIKEREAKG